MMSKPKVHDRLLGDWINKIIMFRERRERLKVWSAGARLLEPLVSNYTSVQHMIMKGFPFIQMLIYIHSNNTFLVIPDICGICVRLYWMLSYNNE